MIRLPSLRTAALIAAFSIAVAGCNDGPKIVPVTGTITRNGKPVANVEVTFTPTPGRPSVGHSDADGKFKLQYSHTVDGALVGTHTVSVKFFGGPGENAQPGVAGNDKTAIQEAILQKYGNPATSPLKIEVPSGGGSVEVKLD